jgi:CBS domain-containing protein
VIEWESTGVASKSRTFTVHQFMTSSPQRIWAGTPLADAHAVLRATGARHLPVVDGTHVVGLLSLAGIYFSEGSRRGQRVTVRDAMEPALTFSPDAALERVAETMAKERASAVVVVDHGQIAGIFTTTDALRALAWIAAPAEEQSAYEALRVASLEPADTR